MVELVPSKQMREYYENIGFEFTDFQKATLIWNAPNATREEVLNLLRELGKTTEDGILKKQILERVQYEEKVMTLFLDNTSGEYVYVVENTQDGCACGFFGAYENAAKYSVTYSKKYETKCRIEKQFIVKEMADNEYDGEALSGVNLDKLGFITELWSKELLLGESMTFEYETGRFENAFVKVPFHLERGTFVKNVVNGHYGVLAHGKEEWDKYLEQIGRIEVVPDYSDVQVIVYELDEIGSWRHHHINPLYLEREFSPELLVGMKQFSLQNAMQVNANELMLAECIEECENEIFMEGYKYAITTLQDNLKNREKTD